MKGILQLLCYPYIYNKMDNKSYQLTKSCSIQKMFICIKCDYNTNKKSSWVKHTKTNKHTSKGLFKIYPNEKVEGNPKATNVQNEILQNKQCVFL